MPKCQEPISSFPAFGILKWIGEVCSFYPSARALESSKYGREALVRSLSHSPSTNRPTYDTYDRDERVRLHGRDSAKPILSMKALSAQVGLRVSV